MAAISTCRVKILLRGFFLSALLLPLTGCNQPKEGVITGTVTFAGAPLPSGTVSFVDGDGQAWHSGIGANGSYRIKKAPVGAAKIKVVSHPRVPPGMANAKGPDTPKNQKQEPPAVQIPPKYNDADKSGLVYDVKQGEQKYDIELTK